ncbi:uncharacterized protein LOC126998427 isoform X2 [Eriocheir sinensis]|uniref:uncharacterized protein LOC126998427 isoform X2 n=1 Tax=Eriocheir sinensis TaxID=95602 RepID=UPI0021CA42CD|nr:uncharacterized protein LOC126998427 isoform X2 [Eriocheir sinensis]
MDLVASLGLDSLPFQEGVRPFYEANYTKVQCLSKELLTIECLYLNFKLKAGTWVRMMQRQHSVILTPARQPPPPHAVPELSSLGQLILASLTPTFPSPLQLPKRIDPSSYYKEVYYRQFQAEPEAQPGCTQPYSSQTQTCDNQRNHSTSLTLMRSSCDGKVTERMTSNHNWMFGPQMNGREHSEADPNSLQQDFASLLNVDFEHQNWDEIDQNVLTIENSATAIDNKRLPISKTSQPNLQKSLKRKLAPRIVNKVSFLEDNFEPTPQDELMIQQMELCDPHDIILGESHAPPTDLLAPDDFTVIEPHLFDLSLSPIMDPTPKEAENTNVSHDRSGQCIDFPSGVTGSLQTSNIVDNRVLLDHQNSNFRIQDAAGSGIDKPIITNQCSLQNQQHAYHKEAKTGTCSEKEVQPIIQGETRKDLRRLEVNIVKDNVTSFPLSDATNTHANSFNDKDGRSLQNSNFIVEHLEENINNHDMNHHVSMFSAANKVINQQENVTTGKEGKIDRCSDEDHVVRQGRKNTSHDVFLQQEDKVPEMRSLKINLEAQEDCNESVDMFNITTDTLQTEPRDPIRFEESQKDVGPQLEDPQALNQSVDIFSTPKYNISLSKAIRGRKEDKTRDKSSKELQLSSSRTFTEPSLLRSLEKRDETLDKGHALKTPHFKAPYKVVSGSPFIGYPSDRKNVTSTPKEAQQKKVRRFGSGYSSDSSETKETMKDNNDPKSPKRSAYKHFTLRADAGVERTCSDSGQNSLPKRKLEFKPKFMSRLSSFKFSVSPSKKAKTDIPLCSKSKNKPNINAQDSLNFPARSIAKSNGSKGDTSVNLQNPILAEPESGKSFLKKRQEISDIMEHINKSLSKQPDSAVGDDTCKKKSIGKPSGELDETPCNKDPSEPFALKKICSESNKKAKLSTEVKGSAKKRKKEDKEHKETAKKKKTKSTENHYKEKNCKLKGVGKKTLDSKVASKEKSTKSFPSEDVESHIKDSSNTGAKQSSRSVQKSAVCTECSQDTLTSSQADPSRWPLGNEAQLLAVLQYLNRAQEFCMTLLYRDTSSQLRERVSGGRKQHPDSGEVTGLAVRVSWFTDSAPPPALLPTGYDEELRQLEEGTLSHELVNRTSSKETHPSNISVVYKIPLGINFNKEEVRSVMSCIMKSDVRKISFDAQETITLLVEKLEIDHKEVISSWVVLDPKIGGWLLDSDHPPVTFKQTALALKVPLPQAGSGQHTEEEIRSDLEALSKLTASLHTHLSCLGLWTIFLHLEMRITPVLAVMELRDIRVDRAILKEIGQRLKHKIEEVERRCHQVSGSVFNVASHAQLRSVLYQELKLDLKARVTIPRTAKGQKSTGEVALGRLGDHHPLPGLVLQHRLLNKLKTTYVDGILACLHGSCVRASWEQTSASTGRIQCRHPNLQNIPKQPVLVEVDGDEMVVRARECFCSRTGHVLVAADFQQTELRMLAHLSQDSVLLAGFKEPNPSNIDIFKQLSATWLDKPVNEVTSCDRERTKRVVYAVMYGAGKEKLSEVLHISLSEARDIISSFMKRFPSIPAYMKSVVELCRQQGFLTTIFRRRRSFPGITSKDPTVQSQAERQAVNFIIQGSAADLSKAAMVQTEAALAQQPELDAKLLIHIHDELVWEVHAEHTQAFCV